MFKPVFDMVYDEIRASLIDKSQFSEHLTFSQIDFAKEYGFVMPIGSLRKFIELKQILKKFIFRPFYFIHYQFYIIYIMITRLKLKLILQIQQLRSLQS